MVPSALLLTFVMTYFDEPIVNSYDMGAVVGKRAISSLPVMVVVPLLESVKGMALVASGIEMPLASQAFTVMAAGVDRVPDISVILMEFRGPTELATNFVVPLVYPLGTFRVLSELLLTFVMIYLAESALKAYVMGVPVGKLSLKSVPEIVVVPLL